ncbi:MAG: hypothetical protein ABIL22_04210 [candidate division WOR-3 bacterium]
MKDFLTIIGEKTQEFGNHYRKQLQAIKKFYEPLLDKIEINKKREMVHFLHPSTNFPEELRIVANVAETMEEKLNFVGAYFSLHLLWINRQLIDTLKMELLAPDIDKIQIYRRFMRRAGNQFRYLTAAYIEELLQILKGENEFPRFVIMGVGTKSDQDDLDVGIVDDGTENRDFLNRIIARMSKEMFKFAVSFHFHLSEHIGSRHYSASIGEYKEVLSQELRDFVIINEMLGAAVIVGDNELSKQFQNEVILRYYYRPDSDMKYHEGYLRGILGEVRALLARPISKSRINFKEDGLRPIKSIISAKKTVFNIRKVNAWDILDELLEVDQERVEEYDILEKSLTFVEIFRYLYQMFVTQDEEIVIDDAALKNIRKIAQLLGYTDIGLCRAEEHLLVHYYEHIQNIHRIVPHLINDLKNHLKGNSVFTLLFEEKYQGNLVQDFINRFKFFRGASYWDDILDDFGSPETLERFSNDFCKFNQIEQDAIIQQYIEWLKFDFYTLFTFLSTLSKNKNTFKIYEKLNEAFLIDINNMPDIVRNIAFVYSRYPGLLNEILSIETPANLNNFAQILQAGIYEEEIATIVNDFRNLIEIYLSSSHFFRRYFIRTTRKYQECLRFLKDANFLKEYAEGIYGDISPMRTFPAKKEKLGDYYDFEMVRVSLATLRGMPIQATNTEFIEFADQYIRTLYDICREETDAEMNKRIITEDVLAIFAAGGHAREQAYDDDYDLIVLLNSEDPNLLSYSNRVISKMNAEIIKRGTIPHHRFAEYFGRFVITLKEIEQLLAEDRPDIFIEQSQILGARLIAGSHRFEREFLNSIIHPHVFGKKAIYIRRMIDEINSRHSEKEYINSGIDIKECPGGLRDIEMIMLILKAHLEITEPVNSKLFEILSEKMPRYHNEFAFLSNSFNFLKTIRDIYRLTIGATDVITKEGLKNIALIMNFKNERELYEKFSETRAGVTKTIQELITSIRSE